MFCSQVEDRNSVEKKKYAFSSKNNATREIESWGRDYGSLAEGSMRSAGQLTENVTEARMLQSRIMEMSRDRYKYSSQSHFNKKFFLNAQQKKTRLMPQLLHGVDIEYWLSKKTSRHVPQFTASSSSNARFAFLDRLEKQGEKCKDFDEEENPFDMPSPGRKPIPQQPNMPEFYRIRLQEQQEAEMAKNTFPTQPILKPQTAKKAVTLCDAKEVKLPEVASSAKCLSTAQRSKSMGVAQRPQSQDKARLRRVQSSISGMRSVEDPRYRTLESSLSSKFSKPEETDPTHVQSIINAHDSLFIPSKQAANSRPKVQKTILEYLRARGFDV